MINILLTNKHDVHTTCFTLGCDQVYVFNNLIKENLFYSWRGIAFYFLFITRRRKTTKIFCSIPLKKQTTTTSVTPSSFWYFAKQGLWSEICLKHRLASCFNRKVNSAVLSNVFEILVIIYALIYFKSVVETHYCWFNDSKGISLDLAWVNT